MIYDPRPAIPVFRFDSFPDDGVQTHAVFTRQGGVSRAPFDTLNLSSAVADEPERLAINRARAYGAVGRSTDSLVHQYLVHGRQVQAVGRAQQGKLAGQGDGLITDEPGCGLTMNFADCAPILLYDPVHRAIGLGHAGWKGAVEDLAGSMVRAMVSAYGSRPATLLAGIGPCIGPGRYEVDEPVISAVRGAFANPGELLRYRPDRPRPHFDLPLANQRNLERAGVRYIEQAGLCTASRTDLFFSHRAEQGRTGRFGVVFLLNGA